MSFLWLLIFLSQFTTNYKLLGLFRNNTVRLGYVPSFPRKTSLPPPGGPSFPRNELGRIQKTRRRSCWKSKRTKNGSQWLLAFFTHSAASLQCWWVRFSCKQVAGSAQRLKKKRKTHTTELREKRQQKLQTDQSLDLGKSGRWPRCHDDQATGVINSVLNLVHINQVQICCHW